MKTITYEDKRGKEYKENIPESCLEDVKDSLNLMGFNVIGEEK